MTGAYSDFEANKNVFEMSAKLYFEGNGH